MMHILSNEVSLVNSWINELRNVEVQTDRMKFRRNMERIGEIAAFEISKKLDYKEMEITTPLDKIKVKEIAVQPVITTILRAGVPLFQGVLNYFDKARKAFADTHCGGYCQQTRCRGNQNGLSRSADLDRGDR